MKHSKILIVDDDLHLCEIIRAYCENEGFQVAAAHNCDAASKLVENFRPDLIVLDIMLTNENGIQWCQTVRNVTSAVIIFLSSRQEDEVKIRALTDGGDDYVTKPISPKVLIAKIKAHLRRTSAIATDRYLEFPGMTLDFVTQNVYLDGQFVELSKKEFGLLAHMAQSPNQIIDSSTLLQQIWGTNYLEDTRTVAVHISNLRKKIESDPSDPKWIVTVRGIGYRFAIG